MLKIKSNLVAVIAGVLVIGLCAAGGWIMAGGGDFTKFSAPATTIPGTSPVGEDQNVLDVYDESSDLGKTIVQNGHTWRYNSRLRTVLFLGIDSTETVQSNDIIGTGGRADVIDLYIIDPDAKTVQMLEISRDTIMKVDVYDHDRDLIYSGNMQINMQYAFSDSPSRGCNLMKRKVSELLYGSDVDFYCSLTMDSIAAAADALGGITVTMDRDWTQIDPHYTAGAAVTMNGEEAERFIRYRDLNETGSNDTRMQRHEMMMQQMMQQIHCLDESGFSRLLDALAPYMETDMDADTIRELVRFQDQMEPLKVPGSTVAGERHDEFYVDEPALRQMLMDLFYRQVD